MSDTFDLCKVQSLENPLFSDGEFPQKMEEDIPCQQKIDHLEDQIDVSLYDLAISRLINQISFPRKEKGDCLRLAHHDACPTGNCFLTIDEINDEYHQLMEFIFV